jgi:hypothetical protein
MSVPDIVAGSQIKDKKFLTTLFAGPGNRNPMWTVLLLEFGCDDPFVQDSSLLLPPENKGITETAGFADLSSEAALTPNGHCATQCN